MTLPRRSFTYAEYLTLPDDERYELIEGELHLTPAPTNRHQKISMRLSYRLMQLIEERSLGTLFSGPTDLVLSEDTVLQPDLLFIAREREAIIGEKSGIFGAPDLVVEILSPSTATRDLVTKKRLYETHGVREYWIIDPEQNFIEVYTPQGAGLEIWQRFEPGSTLQSPLLIDLHLDVTYILAI